MGILEDLADAISGYPVNMVDVTITSFAVIGAGVLNVGDVAQFRIQISNRGQLNMVGIHLHVYGSDFALVSGINGGFSKDYVSFFPMSVNALGVQTSSPYYLKAIAPTKGIQEIVTARIESWDANLDNLLIGQSAHGPTQGKLSQEVLRT